MRRGWLLGVRLFGRGHLRDDHFRLSWSRRGLLLSCCNNFRLWLLICWLGRFRSLNLSLLLLYFLINLLLHDSHWLFHCRHWCRFWSTGWCSLGRRRFRCLYRRGLSRRGFWNTCRGSSRLRIWGTCSRYGLSRCRLFCNCRCRWLRRFFLLWMLLCWLFFDYWGRYRCSHCHSLFGARVFCRVRWHGRFYCSSYLGLLFVGC